MKTATLLTLIAAFALLSAGCSASARVSVDANSASKLSTDPQVAYIAKPQPVRR